MPTPRIAFVFPGQGSHRPGMASAWLPDAEDLFEDCSDATGLDLVAIADDADACAGSTRLGQPAIHVTSLVALAALTEAGVTPDVVAGHSLGEVTAAVAAGVHTPTEGAALVAARGRAMGRACRTTPGAMAAVVRLEASVVEAIVAEVQDAVVANVNAEQQVVVAGTPEAVATVRERVAEAGGRALPLPVEGAFHSPAMTSAVVALTAAVRWVPASDPHTTMLSGIDGAPRLTGAEVTRAIVEGVLAPVRWLDVQRALVDAAVGLVVEVGPGGVLAGLAKRAMPDDVEVVSVARPADVPAAVAAAHRVRSLVPA